MKVSFRKMHGAGNDFIVIKDLENNFPMNREIIYRLCHRQFGIGGDGLILIRPAQEADFRMVYFNSDGLEGSMCGNGGRTAAVFAYYEKIAGKQLSFEAIDGMHHAVILSKRKNQFQVSLSMKDVTNIVVDDRYVIVDTGSPHLIVLTDKVAEEDVFNRGRTLRFDKRLSQNGLNVNFLERSGNKLFIITYERGVENETLSCGTGVTAAAIAAKIWFDIDEPSISAPGGDFRVQFHKTDTGFTNIFLIGPVSCVFQGEIKLEFD